MTAERKNLGRSKLREESGGVRNLRELKDFAGNVYGKGKVEKGSQWPRLRPKEAVVPIGRSREKENLWGM